MSSWTVHVVPSNDACPAAGLVFPFSVEGLADVRRALERTRERCSPLVGLRHSLQLYAHTAPSRVAGVPPVCTTCSPAGYEGHIGESGYSYLGERTAGDTRVSDGPCLSMTGVRLCACMATIGLLYDGSSRRHSLHAPPAGVSSTLVYEQLPWMRIVLCGMWTLPLGDRNTLVVVRHANAITTGVTAKIGFGAGHGARIVTATSPGRLTPISEWARMRAARRMARRARAQPPSAPAQVLVNSTANIRPPVVVRAVPSTLLRAELRQSQEAATRANSEGAEGAGGAGRPYAGCA